jgi:hypothetical protein
MAIVRRRNLPGTESLALMLIIGMAASACGNVAIGPVDHGCYVNPARAQGSGCER